MAQATLDHMNFSMIQSQSRMDQEQKNMDILFSTFTENIVDDKLDQNFSQNDNVVPKKKMKWRKDYSNTKVKTRNILTNVSYRIFKQLDFNKTSSIVHILSFLVQNFNLINLERKLDVEKERDMVKYLWDDCIPHDFVRYMYKQENYAVISKLNLTYQKTNKIVKNFLLEESNRINILKYKIGEKFPLIHFIYSLLLSKIYNRTKNFGIQKKNNFDFYFQTWRNRETASAIAPKLLTAKDPSNYQDRAVQKNEQMLIYIKISNSERVRPTMLSVNNTIDETVVEKRAEKRKMLEKQLSENTVKMNKIKKSNKL